MSFFSDFESDLTELSSSEDDYVPTSRKAGRKKAPKPEYRLNNTLSPPRNTSYSAMSLYNQMKNRLIELEPEYQRGVVWGDSKQSYLIDSLFRNYYIPPVIFAVTRTSDGIESRVCIDGKQRLTSILKFLDGLIPHKDSYTGERLWYRQPSGSKKVPLLPRQYILQFENKQIPCVEYDALTDSQEREIFQRVQLGVALTPAERMQALTTPYPVLIRDIQRRLSGPDGFGEDLEWNDSRGRDFQCIAATVVLIAKPKPKLPNTTTLDHWLREQKTLDSNLKTSILETYDIYIALAKDTRYNACFKMCKVSPVEFTMAGFLIHQYKSTFSMRQLSSAIKRMRNNVRDQHSDIRANAKVSNTILKFINTELKKLQPTADDVPAVLAVQKQGSKSANRLKRKRAETDREDEQRPSKPSKSADTSARAPGITIKIPSQVRSTTNAASSSSSVSKQVAHRSQPLNQASSSASASTSKTQTQPAPAKASRTTAVKTEKMSPVATRTAPASSGSTRPQEPSGPKASSSSTAGKDAVRTPTKPSSSSTSQSRAIPPSQPSPSVTVKTEQQQFNPPIGPPRVDRLAAIRRAKQEQQQRRLSAEVNKAGPSTSRQSSGSLPSTPVDMTYRVPPSGQSAAIPSSNQQGPAQQSPPPPPPPPATSTGPNGSSAMPPPSTVPSGVITLSNGEQIDERVVLSAIAHFRQSPQDSATPDPIDCGVAASAPTSTRQSPVVTLPPTISQKPSEQDGEKMQIDDPPQIAEGPQAAVATTAVSKPVENENELPPNNDNGAQPSELAEGTSHDLQCPSGRTDSIEEQMLMMDVPQPTPMTEDQQTPPAADIQASNNPLSVLTQSPTVQREHGRLSN